MGKAKIITPPHPKQEITWFIKTGIKPYLKLFPVVPYFYEVPCFKMFKNEY